MNDSQFEDQIRQYVPIFIVKQFRHLLPLISTSLRPRFIRLIRTGSDMGSALHLMLQPKGQPHKPLVEYVHQRMQDNMSEILD